MSGAAPLPEPRTVTAEIREGRYAGWRFTARRDWTVRELMELNEGLPGKAAFLDRQLLEHNFPDREGNVAASMLDVYPADAIGHVLDALTEAIATTPFE